MNKEDPRYSDDNRHYNESFENQSRRSDHNEDGFFQQLYSIDCPINNEIQYDNHYYPQYPPRHNMMARESDPWQHTQVQSEMNHGFPKQEYTRKEIQDNQHGLSNKLSETYQRQEEHVEKTPEIRTKRRLYEQPAHFSQHQIPRQSYHHSYENIRQYRDLCNRGGFSSHLPHQLDREIQSIESLSFRKSYAHPQLGSFESFMSSHSSHDSQLSHLLISDINENDVLCGRGGATNIHLGNRQFRSIVKQYREEYLSAKKKDKPKVASLIVDIIRNKDPPGRFLKKNKTRNGWYEIGDIKAKEKTSQALREGAPVMRQKKQSSGTKSTKNEIKDTEKRDIVEKDEEDRYSVDGLEEENRKSSADVGDDKKLKSTYRDTKNELRPNKIPKHDTFSSSRSYIESRNSLSPREEELLKVFDPPRAQIPSKHRNQS